MEHTLPTSFKLRGLKDVKYNGYIHLPEPYIIILPPQQEFVDIDAFGVEEKFEYYELFHGVVDNKVYAE